MHTSVQAMFFLTDDADKVAKIKGSETGERSIAGSPAQIVDAIGEYGELGFDEVIVPDFTLGSTQAERAAAYETFTTEIVPHFG